MRPSDKTRWLSLAPEKSYCVEDALLLLDASDSSEAPELLELERARSALGALDHRAFLRARAACNPCENLKKGWFVCRSALKLANLNAISGFRLKGKFLDLCSAPGGFGEYLSANGSHGFGMSLRGCNGDGQGLDVLVGRQIWGPKGDGNLYDRDNCRAVVEASGPADLCVCDGGFQANRNEIDQDAKLERLALCEAATAWEVLRDGGNLVIKLFLPLRSPGTTSIVAVAALHFKKIGLVKPVTSRAASGELYLLALGFRRPLDDPDRRKVVEAFWKRADRLSQTSNGAADRPVCVKTLDETLRSVVLGDFLATARTEFVQAQTLACREILRFATTPEKIWLSQEDRDLDAYFDAWRLPRGKRGRKRGRMRPPPESP